MVRTSLAARAGAALIALTLSGAPALAAQPERSEHRCLCKAHSRAHECACARCHEASATARQASEAKEPPCHRAVAKGKKHAEPRELAGGPCITGVCGGPEQRHGAALTALDAFTPPQAHAQGWTLPSAGRIHRPPAAERDAPSVPETPPPRAAFAPVGRA